jgi:hypothetical protein
MLVYFARLLTANLTANGTCVTQVSSDLQIQPAKLVWRGWSPKIIRPASPISKGHRLVHERRAPSQEPTVYARVPQLKLDENPRRESGEDAEEDDQNNARHHADLWSRVSILSV